MEVHKINAKQEGFDKDNDNVIVCIQPAYICIDVLWGYSQSFHPSQQLYPQAFRGKVVMYQNFQQLVQSLCPINYLTSIIHRVFMVHFGGKLIKKCT